MQPPRLARFIQKMLNPPPTRLPSDSDIKTICIGCAEKQNLQQAVVTAEDEDTLYTCHACGELLVVISRQPTTKWTGPGYSVHPTGRYRLRNKSDLVIQGRKLMNFPGSPDACARTPAQEPSLSNRYRLLRLVAAWKRVFL